MHRGFKFDLKPTRQQAERLRAWAGTTRFVYNLCLEQRRDFWRQYLRVNGRHLNWAAQSREVTDLRSQVDWIADVPRSALERAIRDLEMAYAAFFAGRSGYPTHRIKGRHDAFKVQARDVKIRRLNRKWGEVRLSKVGWVKFRLTREATGDLVNATFALVRGKWSVSFACEIGAAAASTTLPAVGIDRGVVRTITLSNGETMQAPSVDKFVRRRARAQRVLFRRQRGSKRHARQRQKVAALDAKMARVRVDWSHRVSTDIARRLYSPYKRR